MAKSASANKRNDETKTSIGIKLVLIVVAILCVLTLAYTICDTTGVLARGATAMTVGEDKVSAMELNLYYSNTRSTFMSQNGSYLSNYGYDTSSSAFDAQTCLLDSSMTWKQYFTQQAESSAEQISILYQEAKANGHTMSDKYQQQYDDYIANISTYADEYGYSVGKYISALYGAGTKLSDVEAYFQKRCLASSYYDSLIESFSITDQDIQDYYKENPDSYDVMDYDCFAFPYTTYTYKADSTEAGAPTSEEEATAMTETARKEAQAKAEEMMAQVSADGSNFDELAKKYYDERTTGNEEEFSTALVTAASISDAASVPEKWAADAARKAGDLEVMDNAESSEVDVVYYVSRYTSPAYTVAMRHILLKTETAEDGADDATVAKINEANAEVEKKAQTLYDQWKAGDATEDSFAKLAIENSEDPGSADNGGLYEGVYEGQMVTEFNDWCFAEGRKPGDTEIVKTSYGYHIMYFVKQEGPKYISDIRSTLEQNQFNDLYEGLKENYPMNVSKLGVSLM